MSTVEEVQALQQLASEGEQALHEVLDNVHQFLTALAQFTHSSATKAGEKGVGNGLSTVSLQELSLRVATSLSSQEEAGDRDEAMEEAEEAVKEEKEDDEGVQEGQSEDSEEEDSRAAKEGPGVPQGRAKKHIKYASPLGTPPGALR